LRAELCGFLNALVAEETAEIIGGEPDQVVIGRQQLAAMVRARDRQDSE
jgi:hypothetical protein